MNRVVTIHAYGDQPRSGVALRFVAGSDKSPQQVHRLEATAQFEETYRQFHSRIHRLALRITRNQQDAEDVVQECFMRAFQHLDTFSGRSKLSTWISRIAINAALMKIRKRKLHEFYLEDIAQCSWASGCAEIAGSHHSPDQQLLQRERAQIVAEGLARLNPRLSTVVNLHYFAELSAQECAQILGISLPNAKGRILRARLKLRPLFERRFRRPFVPFHLGGRRKRHVQQPDVKHGVPSSQGNEHAQ